MRVVTLLFIASVLGFSVYAFNLNDARIEKHLLIVIDKQEKEKKTIEQSWTSDVTANNRKLETIKRDLLLVIPEKAEQIERVFTPPAKPVPPVEQATTTTPVKGS